MILFLFDIAEVVWMAIINLYLLVSFLKVYVNEGLTYIMSILLQLLVKK